MDNRGTIDATKGLTLNLASATHSNTGTINVPGRGLTVTGFDTFTNSGLIDVTGSSLTFSTFNTLTNTGIGVINAAGGEEGEGESQEPGLAKVKS